MRFWTRWRRVSIGAAVPVAGMVLVGMLALWWRLGSGPIDFDFATPWLAAAIEENFGNHHRIAVGGTQLERDASGRTALRIRDIVVRDAHGEIVASAPKAEVSFSGTGLMTGRVRARRLSLVGAEMQVRIEPDSKVTVFAGTNRQPFVTASATEPALRAGVGAHPSIPERAPAPQVPGSRGDDPGSHGAARLDRQSRSTGLDGRDLSELGLKNGNLTLFDQRNGKQWEFQDINLSLTRPGSGGVALTISSEAGERPWLLRATVSRGEGGIRKVEIETERLPAKDLLLALRIGDGQYRAQHSSLRPRARVDRCRRHPEDDRGPDPCWRRDTSPTPTIRLSRLTSTGPSSTWNGMRRGRRWWRRSRSSSGGNRLTLFAQLTPPRESVTSLGAQDHRRQRGARVVGRATRTRWSSTGSSLACASIPTSSGSMSSRAKSATWISGSRSPAASTISGEARLALGIAGTRMSVAAMKRLWPSFINPKVHAWVSEHILSGTVERVVIATNAPIATFKTISPPIPDDGLAIEISGNGAEIRPVDGLPPIRDADMRVRITGRTASVAISRGNIDVSAGRRLAISNGLFEVPDHYMNAPRVARAVPH